MRYLKKKNCRIQWSRGFSSQNAINLWWNCRNIRLWLIPTNRIGYSLNPCIYEVFDFNNTLKYNLPDNVEVGVTKDDVRLKSKLKKSNFNFP